MWTFLSAEHYGFLLEDNPHDTVFLPPALFPTAKHMPYKHCFLHASGVPSWELMKALRLSSQHPKTRKATAHLAAAGQPCSTEGELLVRLFPNTLQSFSLNLAHKPLKLFPLDIDRARLLLPEVELALRLQTTSLSFKLE